VEARPLRLEYKRRGSDLRAAFDQLKRYALSLENLPLLAVCDFDSVVIRTGIARRRGLA
jgi:hypothetical protein